MHALPLLVALAAPALWAASTHLDKILVGRYFEGRGLGALLVFTALINLVLLPAIVLAGAQVLRLPPTVAALQGGAGALYMFAMYLYLLALRDDDASAIAPFFQAAPLFACLLGVTVLHEELTASAQFGIVLIVAGGALLSFRGGRFRWRQLGLLLLATFLIALSSLLFKEEARGEFWVLAFWNYAGQTLVGLLPLIWTAPRRDFIALLRAGSAGVLGLNGLNEAVNLAGGLAQRYALTLAPLGITQALTGTTPLFVFGFGVLLSHLAPRVVHEDLSRHTLLLRGACTVAVVAGVALIAAGGGAGAQAVG